MVDQRQVHLVCITARIISSWDLDTQNLSSEDLHDIFFIIIRSHISKVDHEFKPIFTLFVQLEIVGLFSFDRFLQRLVVLGIFDLTNLNDQVYFL